jgi:hypothetical protein
MSKQQSEQLREILCDFMEQIEEVGSEIAGSPTAKDISRIDAVYDGAVAKIEALLAERERLARLDDLKCSTTNSHAEGEIT